MKIIAEVGPAPNSDGLMARDWLIVGAALAASALLIHLVFGAPVVTLAFVGGIAVLGALAFALDGRRSTAPVADPTALPDWSVTVAAIEQPGVAVAITDRANRLVCANTAFTERFGPVAAPPNLALDAGSLDRLSRAARMAWRDGGGQADLLDDGQGKQWSAAATRAGRGDDHLIWRFQPLLEDDPLGDMHQLITGQFGALLSQAGIESAIVTTDGIVTGAGAGFAQRAAGDESATLAGQEFVALLRSDERERIYFAREGRKGTPQTLVNIPLGDAASVFDETADRAPSLMLLLDAGVGVGAGWGGEGEGRTPQLQALLEQLPLGLAMADRDGRFLFANPAFQRAAAGEGHKLPPYPSDLVVKEDKGALADAVRRFAQGPANSGDLAVRLRALPDDPVSLGLAGVRGLGDASVLLSLSDTTEETRLKRQVAQATKMQAVGQLAGGVAHDFNNVLTAIIGYCDLMLLRHTPGDSDYDDIQQIKQNSNRAASLTRQLLAFSRQQTLRPEIVQLPDVVSEVSQLLKRLMGERIAFDVRHDRNLGAVRADPQQLEQVIVNLAVNARDAMQARGDGGGRLSLTTKRIEASHIAALGSGIIPVGNYTALVVEDSGGGIPAKNLGKIFEPFFTTKELGKGTGLGLSTVYGIVKQSGGFIFADNIVDGNGHATGACFTVFLPVHHGAVPAPSATPPIDVPSSEWSGGGHILLVEDEDTVRAVAERALVRQGYAVTPARDGEEGLEKIAAGAKFDLVVSDVVMPVMDGPAMARQIRKRAPKMPILFMSGYAEEQLRAEIDLADMYFLPKPFSVKDIAEKVGGILQSTR